MARKSLSRTARNIIDLPVLDRQPAHMPVAAQIGQAECIPLVAGHHAERALGGSTRTYRDHGRRSCRTGDKRLITGSDHELRADMPLPGPIAVFHSAAKSMGRAAEMCIDLTGYGRPARLAGRATLRRADIDGTLTFEAPLPVPWVPGTGPRSQDALRTGRFAAAGAAAPLSR